jgi:hypothetical protein
MKEFPVNHYERAFENWLIDNHIEYVAFDEHKRATCEQTNIKSFDFLLYLPDGQIVIAEIKGRTFKGTSLARLASMECWVTIEDIEGLAKWQQIFGQGHQAIFVFAYRIENIDVDFDGRDVYEFDADRYLFLCIKLDDYRRFMVRRSPKWQTVTLPADQFRQCAVQLADFLF